MRQAGETDGLRIILNCIIASLSKFLTRCSCFSFLFLS